MSLFMVKKFSIYYPLIILSAFLFFSSITAKAFAKEDFFKSTQEDQNIRQWLKAIAQQEALPLQAIANDASNRQKRFASFFLSAARLQKGKPYFSATAQSKPEILDSNINYFDCVTFIESSLAAARCAFLQKETAACYKQQLTLLRYRHGCIDGYASKLHYFEEFILRQQQQGILQLPSNLLPHRSITTKLNFMSQHRSLYAILANELIYKTILKMEANIPPFEFAMLSPQQLHTEEIQKEIQSADIIALLGYKEGLLVAHLGIAAWQGSQKTAQLNLLHASQTEGTIEQPLLDYLEKHPRFYGILLLRVLPP